MIRNEITTTLSEKSTWFVREAVTCEDSNRKQVLLLMAMRYSMAGWMLEQASDGQVLAVFEAHRPQKDRN